MLPRIFAADLFFNKMGPERCLNAVRKWTSHLMIILKCIAFGAVLSLVDPILSHGSIKPFWAIKAFKSCKASDEHLLKQFPAALAVIAEPFSGFRTKITFNKALDVIVEQCTQIISLLNLFFITFEQDFR